MANIGMMEGAYFVGRVELLNWLNDLLKLDYTKVEQTCTGAAHCQIMDAIYPGKVPLSKVNFNAKHEYEYVNNYKVLQNVFDKLNLDKYIDVQKMIKGKYQDNLEFLQWIKRYFDLNYSGGEYNAVERRSQAAKGAVTGGSGGSSSSSSTSTTTAPKKTTTTTAPKKTTATSEPKKTTTATASRTSIGKSTTAPTKVKVATKSPEPKQAQSQGDDERVQELNKTIAELKVTIDGLEKERDFFFSRLREIEILCQSSSENQSEVVQSIFKILYEDPEGKGGEATEEVQEGEATEEVQEGEQQEEIESF